MEQKKLFDYGHMRLLLAMVFVSAIIALLAFANNSTEQSKYLYSGPTTIDVRGEGEILVKPDIGIFSFSVQSEGADAAAAQELSAEAINKILAFLDGEGIEEKDIKTQNYNLSRKPMTSSWV